MVQDSEIFASAPAHLALTVGDGAAEADNGREVRLVVAGQGTIGFDLARMEPFSIRFGSDGWGAPAFEWRIDFRGASLRERREGEWQDVRPDVLNPASGVDPAPGCPYWFSIDAHNRRLIYGKGEMRLGTQRAAYTLSPKPEEGADPYAWLKDVAKAELKAPVRGIIDIWRDPVTSEPPMKVVPHDRVTMEDVAKGEVTVPANLTPTCQILYDNVAGTRFILDTPDFPRFSDAIKASILDPEGWCAKTLEKKASEFGKPDPKATYLRITLGRNQGESPGIPYVMEIWPSGHYSPIHNHGGSNAVIRVLHGRIWVNLFAMLSPLDEEPFTVATFEKGDVTWISPRLNQVHKLENRDPAEPCITIQCYLYAEDNRTHWPYFDYLEAGGALAHFDPNSDADFLDFKAIMEEEWRGRPKREDTAVE